MQLATAKPDLASVLAADLGAVVEERPFMGRLSASLLFFNVDGGIMFKVFVGRDEKRELKTDQLEKFRALTDQLGSVR